jgi:peptidoglycan/xylan/chitin deacetylase (PgdA/CDA1 family)
VKPGEKVFALTFDDGPWPKYTRLVLDILKKHKVKATFFMVGREVARRPDIARAVRDEGHAIGNHSWDHPRRPRDAAAQLTRTNSEIKKAGGFSTHDFPPTLWCVA